MKRKKPTNLSKHFDIQKIIDILCEYDLIHYDLTLDSLFNEKLFGFVDFNEKKIYINKKQSKTDMRDTIIHEMLHIIEDELGVNMDEHNVMNNSKKTFNKIYLNNKTR